MCSRRVRLWKLWQYKFSPSTAGRVIIDFVAKMCFIFFLYST
uniref:Uncharacterized protein n=1 Tax=Arundo donax TaxID=35708 RepID=A0A0A9ACV8_ARUDO